MKKEFKKVLAGILAGGMALSMAACGSGTATTSTAATSTATSATTSTASAAAASKATTSTAASAETKSTATASGASSAATAITLWTYPIGNFKDSATVEGFIKSFNEKYPNITVTVEYLDYKNGDDQVNTALEAGTAPDVIMEGPERLVSNWGAKGKMVDISDLWTDEAAKDIAATSQAVVNACKNSSGVYYEYPLCMTTHCMAINYEVFEKAGALQYIDQTNRTWTTENFIKACQAVRDSGLVQTPGVVYCGGQGGDQGTRALVTNLYGASYTNAEHTEYTINSEKGVKALKQLVSMTQDGSLSYDAGIVASDELQLFANGTSAMTLAWNASNEATYASQVSFTPYAMAFPTDSGDPQLCGGIWGFGIFDNKDAAKIAAAKQFIQFICDDATQGPTSVKATGFFPVRSSFGNVYAGTADETRMTTYLSFMKYLGDYYNVTPGWTEQRTAWWNMLQQVFNGTDAQTAADAFVQTSNAAIASANS
ncbi:MAG TPA: extracellular solute-binding protein [Lachnospiraceae bacterium]|nr:extracellular solute-binding protein [Lachnospiraceae bacterium]